VVHPVVTYPPFFIHYIPQVENTTILSDSLGWTKISGVFTATGGENILTIGNFRDDTSTNSMFVKNSPAFPASYYYIDDVSVEEVLNADAGGDQWFLPGDSLQLGNNPTENASYSWSPSTGLSDPNSPNPKASPPGTTTYVLTKTQCSVTSYDTVTIFLSGVGINEAFSAKNISLYPNPANGLFTFRNPSASLSGELKVFDLAGKLVRTIVLQPVREEQVIDLRELESGMYLYEIGSSNGTVKKDKLIIIH
jgi:hypothetical protein